jgi:hypothetical protein
MNNNLTKLLSGVLCCSAALAYATPPAQIPQSGQTTTVPSGCTPQTPESAGCIASPANSDGALQKGTVGTNVSGRFVAGTGATADCITDQQTGLMWPKNGIIGFAASAGGVPSNQPDYTNTTPAKAQNTWAKALTAVANMNSASTKLCGYGDWRLPNRNELRSLANYGQSNIASWLNNPAQGFSGVQADYYWSSTTWGVNAGSAWIVGMDHGNDAGLAKTDNYYVWPVRGGQ